MMSANELYEGDENKEARTVTFCMQEDEHLVKLDKLCTCLNTSKYFGLTCKYAKYVLKSYGENKYTRPMSSVSNNSFVKKLLPGKSTSSNSEWSKRDWDKVFNSRIDDEYIVVRDSRQLLIRRRALVRGDLIHLRRGDIVPADTRVVSCDEDFVVDNRIITSNSHEIKTTTPTSPDFLLSQNMIFAGTCIIRGNCAGIILATGDQTVFAELTQFATKVRYIKRQSSRGSSSSLSSGSMGSSVGQLSLPSSLDLSQGSSLSIATTSSLLSI